MEKERVGACVECEKVVYCHSGFLEGVQEGKDLFCFACYEKKKS
ncbi:zinc finger protein 282 [Oceanobacillus picturae]|uniref:Zinc finger protein 282 n=1 Tax=Oceanobacillus picturae TaxID=171693 RepID=W9ACZ2_9BACI|nr:hypothetical protein [Oceanobacillus picturae]GAQ17684.1 zinc finger protein 282 [Oceanobacillus picturae]CDO03564.1 hypothetical protein BN988_02080 [Oceanobacillus picturae]